MKKHILKIVIAVIIVIVGFTVLTSKKQEVDYTISRGNSLTDKKYQNNFVTKLSNEVKLYDMTIPEQFEKLGETNEHLDLYLEKETMAIAIKDTSNGYVWYSYDVENDFSEYSDKAQWFTRAGVTIRTYNKFAPDYRYVLDPKERVKITYDMTSNGFIAHVDYTNVKIKFDVVVELDGKDLLIEIPNDSISEYHPKLWTPGNTDVSLNNVLIYPFLGSTEQEDNGYIVIPDGSGAIVSLNETPKYNSGYNAPVYGIDSGYESITMQTDETTTDLKIRSVKPLERVTLPIYGIIHDVGNTGILVIAESGANYATYNYISKGGTQQYYQSYFHYNYRTTYKQFQSRTNEDQHILGFQETPNEFELKQRIVFLSGEDADYVGVAKKYREFLEKNDGFLQNNNLSTELKTKIDIIGNEVESGIFLTRNVDATPYSDVVDLLKTLQNDNFTNLDVTYKTFNQAENGYQFDVFRNLGGKDELNAMIAYMNEESIDFNYYADYVTSYENNRDTATRMNKKALAQWNYTYMYLLSYVNKAKLLPGHVKEDLEAYQTYGINSLALDGFESILYTQNDRNTIRYSTENMAFVNETLEILKEHDIRTSMYNPDAYLYKYTEKYYDAPLTSSELMFIDASIPLVELITSGHMELYSPHLNFISSEKNTLLRMLEYGINPSYVMTSQNVYDLKYSNSSQIYISQYDSLKNRMTEYDAFIREGLNAISGLEMVDHEFLAEGVTLSTYSDGTQIIVNYTKSDFTYNRTTEPTLVPKQGYAVILEREYDVQ